MFRIIHIVLIWFASGTVAQAQAVCTTVNELSRLFTTIEKVIENGGTATSPQLLELRSVTIRNDTFSVNYNMENSTLRPQSAIVLDAFGRAETLVLEIVTHGRLSATSVSPATLLSFNRAMGLLGRLDCPPPISDQTNLSAQTQLPRAGTAITAGKGIDLRLYLRGIGLFFASLFILALPFIGLNIHNKKTKSLRQRFNCDIATTFALSASPTITGYGLIVDISRSGLKVRASDPIDLKIGDKLIVQINSKPHLVTVRWQNAFYFGGDFKIALSEKQRGQMTETDSSPRIRKGKRGRKTAPETQRDHSKDAKGAVPFGTTPSN